MGIKGKTGALDQSPRAENEENWSDAALLVSTAAIRQHNVKCHSGSVSSAVPSEEKARRRGGAPSAASPAGQDRLNHM